MIKFNEKYNSDDFLQFLQDFLPADFAGKEEDIVINKDRYKEITKAKILGYCESLDLYVLEMEHSREKDPRVTIATDAFKILADHWIHKALVVFENKDSDNYRFSCLTISLDLNEKNKAIKKYSNARRYSFYLGANAKVRTPEQQLIKKGRVQNMDDLFDRFSVEVVNKQFYLEVARFFDELVSGLSLPSVSQENVNIKKTFAVRLIGRLMFCWFLKQKKSVSGQLIPDEIFSSKIVSSNYYHGIVEPLFFEVLNTSIDTRGIRNELFDKVPYLNGGLFNPQSEDYYELDRGTFTSKFINTLKISDGWFKDFFELLETYNFTIDENTVFDQELSVDPEMLGRIFENLLAEINPETGSSERKRTGSFYTPRQIVEYMVDQSLIEYLKTKTGVIPEKLSALISYDLSDDEDYPLTDIEKQKIVEAIGSLKILDPACGSGAYPIGALQKIVYMLQLVDPDCKLWLDLKLKGVPDLYKEKIINEVRSNPFDYVRKLDVIKNSIFGVDIQPIAVDVSRLRCFLTLVVESEIDDAKSNRGIEPLPNLDFKFVCANTLIGLPKVEKTGLFDDHSGIAELSNIMSEYFSCNSQRKNEIKLKFTHTQKEILEKTISAFGKNTGELTLKLTTWNPFSNNSNSWFDSEWMFGLEEKFDIVIGNPPYVEHKKLKGISSELKKIYTTYSGTADLYVYFYENGIQNLKEDGILAYITSNKFFRTSYGEKLRKYFTNFRINQIIDFTDVHVFEALVASCIFIISKSNNKNNDIEIAFANDSLSKFAGLRGFIDKNKFILKQDTLNEKIWQLEDETRLALKKKIESGSITINGTGTINVYRGITTGYNPAFIVDNEKSKELINEDGKNCDVIKPLLQGRNIKKWFFKSNNENLLFVPWHFPINNDASIYGASEMAEKKLESEYSALYKHLLKFKTQLSDRNKEETGVRYEWYSLQRCAASYYAEFEKEKIIWGLTADKWSFAYDEEKHFLPSNGYILTSKEIQIKYLLALLNSRLMEYYFGFIGIMTAGNAFTLKQETISELPIKDVSLNEQKPFIDLVEKILAITKASGYFQDAERQAEVRNIELRIDQLVYDLYNISEDEVKIIESN